MVKYLDINLIKQDKNNPRFIFSPEEINSLAETIKKQGIIHPIEIDENNIIICGERRWRASKKAGTKTIACIVKTGLSNFQKLERQYIENAQHNDLTIIEKGKCFKKMLVFKKDEILSNRDDKHKSDFHVKGIKELSIELSEDPWLIRESILLANEKTTIQKAIQQDKIPYTYITEANKAYQQDIRDKLKEKILNRDFITRADLKNTVNLINQDQSLANKLLKKSGEDLRKEIETLQDSQRIEQTFSEASVLSQAFPVIEREYKKFPSTNLAKFIDHLRELAK